MKLLIPIEVEVEHVNDQKPLSPKEIQSVQEAISNALLDAQGNGFQHEKSEELSILTKVVERPIPISDEGDYEIQHEHDLEKTFVCPRGGEADPENEESVVFGEDLEPTTRMILAEICKKVLNADA